MKPRSNTLFHFTNSFDILTKILENGFWPRYSLEDARWYKKPGIDFSMAIPMVCFCDIPLSRIEDHTTTYGKYGLGMTKEWAIKKGLNPILYISQRSPLCTHIQNIYDKFHSLDDEAEGFFELLGLDLTKLMSFTKPLQGFMASRTFLGEKDFFQENEWRYVPSTRAVMHWIPRETYMDPAKLEAENSLTLEHCTLNMEPADIKYIFVKSASEIPALVDFIERSDIGSSEADRKRLLTRIISLDEISTDI